MKNKKILFINTHFIPDYHFGGVVESGSKIYKYLKKITQNITLATVSKNPEKVYRYLENNEKCYKSIIAHRWGFSVELIFGLWKQVKKSDVLFINGTVTFPTVLAQMYALLQNKPFIVSLRGAIEPWRINHKKWKKFFYFKFIVIPLLKKANNIHVTARQEIESLKLFGINKCFLVSNGIDLEQYNDLPEKYSWNIKEVKNKFVFLFMSRMDKEKGIDILIKAYQKFCIYNKDDNDFVLLLVGPDNQGYLKFLDLDFKKNKIVYIPGVYGYDKIKVIRRGDVVILPSYSENFGNIIAEAFACERPVITTTKTPWNKIEKVGCGYYIEPDEDKLFKAMNKMYKLSDINRNNMGKKGREYIIKNFDWNIKVREIYNMILKIGDESIDNNSSL